MNVLSLFDGMCGINDLSERSQTELQLNNESIEWDI
jgi:hypothetical protein